MLMKRIPFLVQIDPGSHCINPTQLAAFEFEVEFKSERRFCTKIAKILL